MRDRAAGDPANPCWKRGATLPRERRNGWLLPDPPTPAAMPADPVGALEAEHVAQGLQLHARTGCPGWRGERLDVGWALGVLHPLATRAVR